MDTIYDSRIATAGFLIQNIDYAFRAWQENSWSKTVSFNDFCEYILPYRIDREIIESWRPEFYRLYSEAACQLVDQEDEQSVYTHLIKEMSMTNISEMGELHPLPIRISDLHEFRIGDCFQIGIYQIMALRAAGLPATFDYTPIWANYGASHYMVKLVDNKKPDKLLTNENTIENTNLFFESSSFYVNPTLSLFEKEKLPENVEIQYIKTIPKVYRYTWSIQPERYEAQKAAKKDEYSGIFPLYHKDVTDEYLDCADITITLSCDLSENAIAYLCVFNRGKWFPVALSLIDENKSAFFGKLGKNIVYLPAVSKDKQFEPAGTPFCIDNAGNVLEILPSETKKTDITLRSKYPFFAYTASHMKKVEGGWFEGANKKDFSDAVTLFHVDYYPYYMQNIVISNSKEFRYFRFIREQLYSLSELAFWTQNEARDTIRLEGTFFDLHGDNNPEYLRLSDNNLETFYESVPRREAWIGLDLGEGRKEQLVKISFAPRNDANCIIPDNDYELYYWKDQWISLGRQRAKADNLYYTQVPEGALFWLKCHSGGKEERIFTYKNDLQNWW